MCYDIKTSLEKQLRRALLDGDKEQVTQITEKLSIFSHEEVNLYHASGFDHPRMFIYTDQNPMTPLVAHWGFVPAWSTDPTTIWNKTLNARGETIFLKPTFQNAAMNKRCILFLEGFYEHHHKNGNAYPYFIRLKNTDIFAVAGLWSTHTNDQNEESNTFSIVTCRANAFMQKIHNNSKLPESRMPLILSEKMQDKWLDSSMLQQELEAMIQPFDESFFIAHTVGPIKGKYAKGNTPNATKEVKYAILESGEQLDLF
jgi:putative SOS response-associated peptidase YedK